MHKGLQGVNLKEEVIKRFLNNKSENFMEEQEYPAEIIGDPNRKCDP